LSGHDPARDADDTSASAAADDRPTAPRGRFGAVDFPVDANLAAAAERALPSRRRLDVVEDPDSDENGPRPLVVWLAVASVMVLLVGGAMTLVLSGGKTVSEPAVDERPTVPTTSIEFGITLPPDVTTGPSTTGPWVPEEPPPDVIVYESPAQIEPADEIIEFRDASTIETLVLANNGGGAGNWVLSVQAGSGLDVSPAQGQLKPGESVEVRILLDRDAGRDLTDWAEDITMIGGGSTRPTNVRVKIFAL
ncbi:MAG: hypothetical protein ACR2QE_01830, partial [Acidimicrobiales bacterium]